MDEVTSQSRRETGKELSMLMQAPFRSESTYLYVVSSLLEISTSHFNKMLMEPVWTKQMPRFKTSAIHIG